VSRSAALAALGVIALVAASGSPAASSRDCTPSEGRQLVVGFVRAFNAGNTVRLDRLFASEPAFQWYSTGKPGARLGRAAYDRSTLMRYFAARHRRGERLRLLWMSRGGNANGYFGFGFHLLRQARDLRPTAYEGKGAAVCSESGARIAVWSVGAQLPPR
jgi:hypothetical protein